MYVNFIMIGIRKLCCTGNHSDHGKLSSKCLKLRLVLAATMLMKGGASPATNQHMACQESLLITVSSTFQTLTHCLVALCLCIIVLTCCRYWHTDHNVVCNTVAVTNTITFRAFPSPPHIQARQSLYLRTHRLRSCTSLYLPLVRKIERVSGYMAI